MLTTDEQERLDECREAALEFCREAVAWAGGSPVEEMAKGTPGNVYGCAIAETIKHHLPQEEGWSAGAATRHHQTNVFAKRGSRTFEHPRKVQEFSAYFDHKLYPDLIR